MKHLVCAAAAVAGIVAAVPAGASTVYPSPTLVTVGMPGFSSEPGADGTYTGSFSEYAIAGANGTTTVGADGGIATKGAFAYDFQFRLPTDGLGSGAVATIQALSNFTKLDLTSVIFDGTPVTIKTGADGSQTARLDNVPITGFTYNDIIIEGISGGDGSFSGVLSFVPSAAPEPAAWAMMILGFGIVGTALRKNRRSESLSFA